jgi:hypothetical protein
MPLKQGEIEKRERKFENVRIQRLRQKSRRYRTLRGLWRCVVGLPRT